MDNFSLTSILISSLLFMFLYGVVRVFYSIWWKTKEPEKCLKQQGIKGTSYKPLIEDTKEIVRLITEAWSKPINLNNQIVARVDPFTLNNVQNYGMISMCWGGKTPRLILMDTEQMKEVSYNKLGHFQKPPLNPLILILTRGFTTLEGEKWAKYRRNDKRFYLAGHETTSSRLTWPMIVLAMHTNWQEKARQEVLQLCANKDPDFEAISRLKILISSLPE